MLQKEMSVRENFFTMLTNQSFSGYPLKVVIAEKAGVSQPGDELETVLTHLVQLGRPSRTARRWLLGALLRSPGRVNQEPGFHYSRTD